MNQTPMVEITGLRKKSFGRNEILHSVSLTVEAGSVTCLIGPSGSGKTTLLRCVNQLETFDSGGASSASTVSWSEPRRGSAAGGWVAAGPKDLARARRQTGMVFQRFNLFPHRTILENVIEGPVAVLRRPRGEVVEEAHELLRAGGSGSTRRRPTPRSSPAASSSASRSRGHWP